MEPASQRITYGDAGRGGADDDYGPVSPARESGGGGGGISMFCLCFAVSVEQNGTRHARKLQNGAREKMKGAEVIGS